MKKIKTVRIDNHTVKVMGEVPKKFIEELEKYFKEVKK